MEQELKEETSVDLKDKAERCVDVLNNFKENLLEKIKLNICLEEQTECLKKMNIFNEGTEILKEIFKIQK